MIQYIKDVVDLSPYLGQPPIEGVRYHPQKLSREEFLRVVPFSVKPSPFYRDGFVITGGEVSGNHPYHLAGMYYFQEPSAMSAVEALQLSGEERVLDLCAAPGSKATAIASRLETGLLVANEIAPQRAKALLENLERMGAARAVVTNGTASQVASAFPGYFDKVLIDSPCSGEGMFRKYPRILEEWSEELVAHCRERSHDILETGAACVHNGGRLVYSTCTFNLEENEKTILWFLERHPEFQLADTGIEGGRPGFLGLAQARRIFPEDGGEGHFVCAMIRNGGMEKKNAPLFSPERFPAERQFLEGLVSVPKEGVLLCRGDCFYFVAPDLPCPAGLRILRAGAACMLRIGRQLKPAHHLSRCFQKGQYRLTEELTLEQAKQYLHGEPVPVCGKGFGVVYVEGLPLGFIKAKDGVGKNHYPKGLRTLRL